MDYRGNPCVIEKCPNNGRRTVPYCSTCSSGMGRAMAKDDPIGYISERQDKLTKFQSRMVYLAGKDKTYAQAKRIIEKANASPLDARAKSQIQGDRRRETSRQGRKAR